MAEFNFYGSWQDTITILEQLLNTKLFRIIADIAYNEPIVYEINSLSIDAQSVLKQNHHIFLESNSYSRYPIKFSEPNKGGYIGILQLRSGPLINMMLPDEYTSNNKWRVGRGRIAFPPYFVIPNTYDSYKPPQELKDIFALSKKIIQKNMVKQYWRWSKVGMSGIANPSIETLWIGKDAINLLETKGYFIKWGQDVWITASDLYKKRDDLS